ncbi:MAG TPA: M23 family metallopeptidase [Campylobacterales bacterium]|nr:M23 family metallopeptidase [Campylobacterales bacterium]HIO71177.1 M23 family metallopeptidase [Campylobacterales bacterium]
MKLLDPNMIPDPPKEKKKIGRKILAVLLVVWFIKYLITSNLFEREPPQIEIDEVKYWNLSKPIKLKISDNYAIKSFRVAIDNGDGNLITYRDGHFQEPKVKSVDINISLPRNSKFRNNYTVIRVEATDFSNWNFFSGNKVTYEETVIVDTVKPTISVVNSSYGIRRGGAATVIFKVDDGANSNLADVYIETTTGKKFIPQPFLEGGGKYYISLVAWDLRDVTFNGKIVAKDRAGNVATTGLNLYLKEKRYKLSNISLKESFLNGKIATLASTHEKSEYTDDVVEYFKIVNEDIRAENEKLITEKTTQIDRNEVITDFNLNPFKPLKGAISVASFGDHRKYFYHDEFVSEANHMGLDLASVRRAPIIASNKGKVVFADDNGVYGISPIIDHGLGLFTLYGHCSSIRVHEGDLIDVGHIIGNTGKTGLALGDHLHFGVYVQGVPVRPEEWMDKVWIKNNVTDVITNAKKIIEKTE